MNVLEIAKLLPNVKLVQSKQNDDYLHKLDSHTTNNQITLLSIISAILTFAFILAVITLLDTKNTTTITAAIFAALLTSYYTYTTPKRQYTNNLKKIETELSTTLRAIAVELTCGAKFETAIENTAKLHTGAASIELRKVNKAIENGKSTPAALRDFAQKWNSPNIQRATSQLIFTYEHGSNAANSLKKLSDELILIQKVESKKHASKLAMGGLIFTAISAILPALFSAYAIVGSTFLEITITPLQIYAIFLLAFPIINTIILLYLNNTTPATLTENTTKENNFKIQPKTIAITAVLLIATLQLAPQTPVKTPLLLIALIAPTAILQFYEDYKKSKESLQMEREIPLAMFQISSYPPRTAFEKILREVANSLPKNSALANELKTASNKIQIGNSVPKALREINHRDSSIVKRAISLLTQTYTTGHDTSTAFSEIAQDTFELQSIDEEVKANATIQKYTVLLSSAIFVPLILSMLTSITTSLHLDTTALETQTTPLQRAEILKSTIISIQIYLVILAGLASTYVAMQEKHLKKALIYASIAAPIALLIFTYIAQTNGL